MITFKKELICPKCNRVRKENIVIAGDESKDKYFNQSIMKSNFFKFQCPFCKSTYRLNYPFVYLNSSKNYVVFMIPSYKKELVLFKSINESYPQILNFKKRLVKDVKSLQEKILILDNDLDDVVIEEIKYNILSNMSSAERSKIDKLYFCLMDNELNRLCFYSKLSDGEDYYHVIGKNAYKYCRDIIKKKNKTSKKFFTNVDLSFIKGLHDN